MGREWGGGGQFTSNLGPEWTGIAPHTKEGFGNKGGSPGKGEIKKGNYQGGLSRGLCALILSTCIFVSCYCVYVANKRTVFRL
jgi:hypothetical protein